MALDAATLALTAAELKATLTDAKIAKILIEDCTHLTLYIGQAINPAHQNPDLPFDLSIKYRLLEELADLVRQFGKDVTCHYY